MDYPLLLEKIRAQSAALGFTGFGVAEADLHADQAHLQDWLAKGQHGQMTYMARHGEMRARPDLLQPGTVSVISVRLDYGQDAVQAWRNLEDGDRAYVARYALGRDYHKLMRQRLRQLAQYIESEAGDYRYRVLVDSAPSLERALARNAGLGWIGKHTCLIDKDNGSWFFLGEIYTDLPLPRTNSKPQGHCGTCTRCIDICPTAAIVAPNRLDARRCISYLTIEHRGSIPEELRAPIGNRIFGCDDCQLVCPWNKFAKPHAEPDFVARNRLDQASLLELFAWSETEFLQRTEGSAIRRTGYVNWLRNLAVAIGNASPSEAHLAALREKTGHPDPVVREHAQWGLRRLESKLNPEASPTTAHG